MKTKNFILTVLLLGLIISRGNAQWALTGNTLSSAAKLGTLNGYDLQFYVDNTQYMDLQASSGFLGIGSSFSPSHLLDVCGGDIDVNTSCSGNFGYMIGGQHVLWLGGTSHSILVGQGAGNGSISSDYSTMVGYDAGINVGGPGNTFVGAQAGITNSTGANNVAIGYGAFFSNTHGVNNTASGYDALYTNSTGISNTANGFEALYSTGTASGNSALGNYAGYNNTESLNTFVGDSAGWDNGSGIQNTYVGYQAGGAAGWSSVNNTTWIGYNSGPASPGSDFVYLGNTSTTWIESNNGVFTTWSDRRVKNNIQTNVPGLAFITKITPITFNYDIHKENELLGTKDKDDWNGKYDGEKITQSGFIAQQVDSVANACGYDFNGVVKPTTTGGLYAIGYSEFVVPLVKSVQELNTKNESLNSKVDSLTNIIQTMQTCLNQICGATGGTTPTNDGTPASVQTIALSSTNAPLLYQNTPNPFGTGGTKINYYLPEGTMGATLVFYDTYGNPIKTVQLSQSGNGTLNITSDNLSSGIYSYSLIVNSNVIDSKKMVLQK